MSQASAIPRIHKRMMIHVSVLTSAPRHHFFASPPPSDATARANFSRPLGADPPETRGVLIPFRCSRMICERNFPISNNMSRRACPAGSLRATASSPSAMPSSSCSFVALISISLYPGVGRCRPWSCHLGCFQHRNVSRSPLRRLSGSMPADSSAVMWRNTSGPPRRLR